ncbi:aspartate-semialdehyde dehydrogenase [Streptomyces sp. NPDC059740]|uniref:aspartate-semialdehyde dehydrogenase n=1 Tax=Streptomyces sp. NPDC059740 TaxID=3346926 RepID=UPI003656B8A2
MTSGFADRPGTQGAVRKPNLAVVGATGDVGRVMLGLLSERADVWGEIRLVAPGAPSPGSLTVRGAETEVLPLDEDALRGADVVVFADSEAGSEEVSRHWAPRAVAGGAVVVDGTAAFRGDPEVPLVVPEVNAAAVRLRPRGIVAGPHCTTLAMIVAVGALHAEYGLEELVLSSYEAVSALGPAGAATLRAQLAAVSGTDLGTAPGDVRRALGDGLGPFPAPVALNVVPWTGEEASQGWSTEELALREESRRVLGLPHLRVAATCVRVPVLTGHAVSVHARFERDVTVAGAHEILSAAPGVVVCDDPATGEFPTPADVVGTDPCWVGRVRRSLDDPRALELFVCADNLRKGSALNLTQLAERIAAELTAGAVDGHRH